MKYLGFIWNCNLLSLKILTVIVSIECFKFVAKRLIFKRLVVRIAIKSL